MERKIVTDVSKNPRFMAKDIVKGVQTKRFDISMAVTRWLHQAGLQANCLSKTTLLKAKHIKGRSAYARSHVEHGSEYWKSVLWLDETKQEWFGHINFWYVWRKSKDQKPKIPFLQLNMVVGILWFGDVSKYHE